MLTQEKGRGGGRAEEYSFRIGNLVVVWTLHSH